MLLTATAERRSCERRPAGFPVKVFCQDPESAGPQKLQARAVDISETGMLLDIPRQCALQPSIVTTFHVPPGVLPAPYARPFRLTARIVRYQPLPLSPLGGFCRVAVEFNERLDDVVANQDRRKCIGAAGAMFLVVLGLVLLLKLPAVEFFWHRPVLSVYGLAVTAYVLSRFLLAFFYRRPRDAEYYPTVSVIVACKNEEEHIGRVLELIFQSNYPAELLEVIAVDDGSTDGTYAEMARVRELYPDLQIIRFERNLGKRHGMAAGARAARGEVLVYVDSDSFLERDTIYRLAQGFHDPEVGAVAAHGFVANAWTNLLTGTQAVQYYVAFRVMKAAESIFGCVTCCSGCCAAYRREAVLEVLDRWLNQTFLGRPATFGDDRSLTNYMLRKYRVIYDSSAICSTIVPDNYRVFFRQQLRWKKSWLRETMRAGAFMWRKPPLMAFSFFAGFVFPLLAPVVVARAIVFLPLFTGHPHFLYLAGVFLMSFLYSAYYLLGERNRLWINGIYLFVLYTLILTWQLPWAIATSWNNKWGTR